jgi:glyoxylate reductase
LDVFEFEPKLVPGLTELSNIVLTPHIASANIDAREAMAQVVVQDVIDFLEGKVPQNIVNK